MTSSKPGALGQAAIGLVALFSACNDEPCRGEACRDGTRSTGERLPREGKPPGQVARLEGSQCVMMGSQLSLQPPIVFVHGRHEEAWSSVEDAVAGRPLLLFWNVCNVGSASRDDAGVQQLRIVDRQTQATIRTFDAALGGLLPCQCVTPELELPAGLPAGQYDLVLDTPLPFKRPFRVRP